MFRKLYFLGAFAYAAMLLLSFLFYKERIIILDTAFTVFNIIKDNTFSIQVYRFGDVFSQLLPVLTRRAGGCFSSIALSYSLGFTLYYATCYFICGSVLKQYTFALAVLMLNLLFVTDTFYWITSQLPQSIALLMVFMALLARKQPSAAIHLLLWPVLVTIAFYHPLAFFCLAYCLLFFAIRQDAFAGRKLFWPIVVVYLSTIVVKAIAFRTPYEQHAMGGLRNFISCFPDYFTLYSNKRFLLSCFTSFYWIPILFCSIAIYYYRTRAYKQLGMFAACFVGYLGLINISYPTAATPAFYTESLYMPLALFLALPFIFDLLPWLATRRAATPVFIAILLTGCVRLYITHNTYTARLNWQRSILTQFGDRKIIAGSATTHAGILQMNWGTPYEFLVLSSCERHRPASIIIDDDPAQRLWANQVRKALVVNWNIFPYSQLSPQYFPFTDTLSAYEIIK
jgi:hypothetical protein